MFGTAASLAGRSCSASLVQLSTHRLFVRPQQISFARKAARPLRVTFRLMEDPWQKMMWIPVASCLGSERDHAVVRLKDAVSEGLIDIDEFDERTSDALVARTRVSWTP